MDSKKKNMAGILTLACDMDTHFVCYDILTSKKIAIAGILMLRCDIDN